MYSTVAAATLSLKGSRHGGANLRTMRQMAEMKRNIRSWTDSGEVADYLTKIVRREAGDGTGLVYGLGHAVYTISDPRAQLLKEKAKMLAEANDRMDEFALYDAIETLGPDLIRKVHPGAKDCCANVDLYSGFVYDMLNIPQDLYTPLFAVARVVGWCAHRMEELHNSGPIIRPAYKPIYKSRPYTPIADRA
jgi:citrate synthase